MKTTRNPNTSTTLSKTALQLDVHHNVPRHVELAVRDQHAPFVAVLMARGQRVASYHRWMDAWSVDTAPRVDLVFTVHVPRVSKQRGRWSSRHSPPGTTLKRVRDYFFHASLTSPTSGVSKHQRVWTLPPETFIRSKRWFSLDHARMYRNARDLSLDIEVAPSVVVPIVDKRHELPHSNVASANAICRSPSRRATLMSKTNSPTGDMTTSGASYG